MEDILRKIKINIKAINTVLSELGRLSKENEQLKLRINDFLEEMRCME